MMTERMDPYLITHRYTCPVCNGDRRVYDPEWAEANELGKKARRQYLDDHPLSDDADADAYCDRNCKATDADIEAIRQFWRGRGYYHDEHWPPEEYGCPERDGMGIIQEFVPLAEALAAIQKQEE
jgi:hypothetical protein